MRNLSGQIPTAEELIDFLREFEKHDDRALALVLTAMVDVHLEDSMKECFVKMGKDKASEIFRDRGAPLGSFSAKIIMGQALGMYNGTFRGNLDRLRIIRNHFAHCAVPTSFKDSEVVKECAKLTPHELHPDAASTTEPRTQFVQASMFILMHILNFQQARQMAKGLSPDTQVPTTFEERLRKLDTEQA